MLLRLSDSRLRTLWRVLLSSYVSNGLSAALGLLLISSVVQAVWGEAAAAAASVGAILVIPTDAPAPRRGKFWQLVPAALIALPLFFAAHALHADALRLGLLLVGATFVAFLAGAWGKRGLPITMSAMFAVVFAMATAAQPDGSSALWDSAHAALGAAAYLVWGTLANALLNARYRVQLLAETLVSVATLMRTQAEQFVAEAATPPPGRKHPIGLLMRHQAALADQLQAARNLLLESPRTPQRLRLAGMLMQVLEMRDHLLACELDLDALRGHPEQLAMLQALRDILLRLADDTDTLADQLLTRRPVPAHPRRLSGYAAEQAQDERLLEAENKAPSTDALAGALARRIGHLDDEVGRVAALASGQAEPDLAAVRVNWQMFISPTGWSWQPLGEVWHWHAPPLRHALRAALAIGSGYGLSLAMPWGKHEYWILLTIVVVLRGSLAQTLERRNSRVAGTLLGCLLAAGLLWAHAPGWLLLLTVTLGQGLAHAFAVRNYLVTAVAATVMALLQAHLLNQGISPTFEVVERVADTLIGVAIAWAFSYVLPSWERRQIPSLVTRTLAAQSRLELGQAGSRPWTTRPSSAGGWPAARPTTAFRPWCRPYSARCQSPAPCVRHWRPWAGCWPTATSCWPSSQ
jgi:uncharacterized membrane protein YccC